MEDYVVRAYSLPPKFGSVAKAYITKNDQINHKNPNDRIDNLLALNLYVLGYDNN